jgi:hypothetical protein
VTLRTSVSTAFIAVTGCCAIVAAPGDFRSALRDASSNSGLSTEERELAPARAVGFDGDALLAARRVIPGDATYFVAASPALTEAARPLTFYWLFPRRYVDEPRDADWIVFYDSDPAELGVPVGRRIRLGAHAVAAEVRR